MYGAKKETGMSQVFSCRSVGTCAETIAPVLVPRSKETDHCLKEVMSHTCTGSRVDSAKHKGTHNNTDYTAEAFLITTCRLRAERWRGGDKERDRDRKEVCMTVSKTGIGKASLTLSRSHVSRLKAIHLLREKESRTEEG